MKLLCITSAISVHKYTNNLHISTNGIIGRKNQEHLSFEMFCEDEYFRQQRREEGLHNPKYHPRAFHSGKEDNDVLIRLFINKY